jgi:2-polyprenyl-6-methoxyphenol hydroxylase-like FAD-dependent oxidoreductase
MSKPTGRVLVAGGGIAGLASATALARRGWSVSLFEKADALREDGACIWLGELAIASLEKIDAAADVLGAAERLENWEILDHRNKVIQKGGWTDQSAGRLVYILRTELHRALVNAAMRAGITVHTSAEAKAATEDGRLILASGEEIAGDLVIAADGLNSVVRSSLPLRCKVTPLRHISMRSCIPTYTEHLPRRTSFEHWCGQRRLGYGWAADGKLGIWLSFPEPRNFDNQNWFDPSSWSKTFPKQAKMFEELATVNPKCGGLINVKCDRWSAGRTVLVGDAAHSMAPHFGQGGGLALLDSVTLAAMLGSPDQLRSVDDIPEKLRVWERHHRFVVDTTQKYATFYAGIQSYWPKPLLSLRSAMMDGLSRWTTARVITEGLLTSA